jgi:hypothetical protein
LIRPELETMGKCYPKLLASMMKEQKAIAFEKKRDY